MKRLVLFLLIAAFSCKAERSAPQNAVVQAARPADHEVQALGYVAPGGARGDAPALAAGVAGGVAGRAPATAAAPAQKLPRLIVRTAEVRVVVGDAATVARTLSAAAEGLGGYVGDARTWREGEQMRGTLTLRVPAARLSELLASVRKLALRVEDETVKSEDLSQEYVDLASQLRNQEAAETELRTLMTDVREKTKRASDVIEMYQQLASVRAQVEQTKGRMQFLEQTSALSTVKIELLPDAIAKPVVTPGWQPLLIMKDAGRALVGTVQWLATVAIWLLIYVAPVILLFGLPIALAVRMVRRRTTSAA